jgi:hypothetical protein
MRHLFLLKKPAFLGMALFILLGASCSKNEQPVEEMKYTTVEIKAITADPMLLSVIANETLLTDTLTTPDGTQRVPVKYINPTHRFLLTDRYTNTLVADTLIDYQPGENNIITFFQPYSGARLVRVGPPTNEPLPDARKKKISIVYSLPYPVMPDEVKVYVDNSKSGSSGSDYQPSDSFMLKRGVFSPYFWSWDNRKPKLRIYDTNGKLIVQVDNSRFAEAVADFSIFSFSGINAGYASLTKLY